ncbi:hypothetical protein [Novosphingobium naphthalenivorans]|uniref:hypothetical protein n=1 Tax=Novosphingobium naphthalenivorans TaxID=273168 RepID=UPI0012ECE9CC|nr:hypothetical protein [Novosphingobium naphthalenivorans]
MLRLFRRPLIQETASPGKMARATPNTYAQKSRCNGSRRACLANGPAFPKRGLRIMMKIHPVAGALTIPGSKAFTGAAYLPP